MRKREALQMLCAVALLPAAPIALAQFGSRRRAGPEKGQSQSREEPRVNPLESSLQELHEDLKLAPQQEPLWESYADKIRALANDVARERNARPSGTQLNVGQRMDRVVDTARNRLAALEDISQAGKSLFESLSPEQKAPADPRLANIMSIPLAGGNR
jgi:hypothetical protein